MRNERNAQFTPKCQEAEMRGLKPLCRVVASATAGVDPALMGTGTHGSRRKKLLGGS